MATFICFLNWTDQRVKGAKEADKRGAVARRVAERMGGRILSAYVTTGQYDVVATLNAEWRGNGEIRSRHHSSRERAHNDGASVSHRGVC
jgi:uncharacterized protein with GYD domain